MHLHHCPTRTARSLHRESQVNRHLARLQVTKRAEGFEPPSYRPLKTCVVLYPYTSGHQNPLGHLPMRTNSYVWLKKKARSSYLYTVTSLAQFARAGHFYAAVKFNTPLGTP